MKVWRYGDDINTDMLFPGKYTYTCATAEEILPHLLEDIDGRSFLPVLLGKNDTRGPDTFFFSNKVDMYYKLYWYDEYDRIDLGASLGTYNMIACPFTNVYWREFANGYVYVNATSNYCANIDLPQPCKQLRAGKV